MPKIGKRYPSQNNLSYIGGEWRTSKHPETLIDPFDGTDIVELHISTREDVFDAVRAAVRAGEVWATTPAFERAEVIRRIAVGLEARAEEFAEQMVVETGKPIREARTEVTRSLSTMRISAEEATRVVGELVPMEAVAPGAGKLGFTLRTPVGVVAAITPFNAPLNSICHKLGPALAGGNSMILKPHPYGSGVAVLMAEVTEKAGLPAGLYNVVHGGGDVGNALTIHRDVAFVNFTGSGAVAEKIVTSVGLKRSLLELGGNAPTIIHADADIAKAISLTTEAAFGLAGQSCISTQRLLVHVDVLDEVRQGFVAAATSRKSGDLWNEDTEIGPLINEESAIRVEKWIQEAISAGATLLCGGRREGTFVEPTVLEHVPDGVNISNEEVFGPVAVIIPYEDIDDALIVANRTPWGLKSGIFTGSLQVAMKAAQTLDFGTVNINNASRARVDQEPSGGVKLSGWGKEGPRYAIREMTNERMITLSM